MVYRIGTTVQGNDRDKITALKNRIWFVFLLFGVPQPQFSLSGFRKGEEREWGGGGWRGRGRDVSK